MKSKLTELERLVELLREHKENPDLDPRSKGLIGNILGELKRVVFEENYPKEQYRGKCQEIIDAYNSDPVIRVYLEEKEEWQSKIRRLESELEPSSYDRPW